MDRPAWLDAAWRELGEREVAGKDSNDRILAFYRDAGHPGVTSDEVAWCAAFVGACLERAGIAGTRSLLARSYLGWGEALTSPRLGAVAVLSRGPDPALGHVGFVVGDQDGSLVLLGGNQRDAVTVQSFPAARLVGLRWPGSPAARPGADGPADVFATALQHVLDMEGGFTDDPWDPGGPTNLGITLAVYAADKGVEVTAGNVALLRSELARLPLASARRIYAERYWAPSRSGLLPAPLALMHFDAAVNHGVSAAARMLQEAARVAVDGEIGPQTIAAANRATAAGLLGRYADLRRARYRASSRFWRFGRGWLRRVDLTLAAARRLAGAAGPSQPSPSNGDGTMPNPEPTEATGKWWGQSITIWGAAITALSTVLPAIAPLAGLDISSDLARQLGEQVVQAVQALGGLIGIAMTIYGRSRATTKLERREITLQL